MSFVGQVSVLEPCRFIQTGLVVLTFCWILLPFILCPRWTCIAAAAAATAIFAAAVATDDDDDDASAADARGIALQSSVY